MAPFETGSIDVYIGRRIKLRRNILGFTQKQVADACKISSQLIQKYETGATSMSPKRLMQIGRALDIPVSFLFSGLPSQTPASDYVSTTHDKSGGLRSPSKDDPLTNNDSLELIRLYWNLSNGEMRKNIMGILRSMAGSN
ncbi:MAG: helix-turn-helix domain-containing protein [Rickettsiales bacterium]|jgi:transcriptional regulator with XRE-family HTH domain|nr:helix-turn-helix domain-containing protein [Rickettsiales bacterium]